MRTSSLSLAASFLLAAAAHTSIAAEPEPAIPHGQTSAPNAARSPDEALRHMTVPPGFSVELVAAEPDIVNPVAMTFDERGRVWITESLEYPRESAGRGRDRIKILEDTDGDGRADKFTIFADGLNIPSGIAVGYGGVWVANAPDILFMQDTDGDDRADRQEVVVTGFGRTDRHELPNSLTWGPDGWLYGFNGVFNHSHVKYRGREYVFNCAMFRIHPRTRDFELFCEGTSNPWGIAFDNHGSAFVSACVIDHLWHLVETGYYHRQGGPYPPFTWKIESIVEHEHQQAAYCGLHWFDSDAYPAEYREKLYMGNIHGACINSDALERRGSTYFGTPRPDFLSANDAWFMPVSQKTGPDGCMYVLDWYDRYHCYQDARRDPEGIDRLKGRLYRVRYNDTPRAPAFDLSKESDDDLVRRLDSANLYFRDLAQRLLAERADAATRAKLERLVLDDARAKKMRMHALWSVVSMGALGDEFHRALLAHADDDLRAWGVRAAGNQKSVSDAVRLRVTDAAHDPSPDVRLQAVIAARKIDGIDPLPLLIDALASSGGDRLVPQIVWQNLHPLLDGEGARYVDAIAALDAARRPAALSLAPRVLEKLLAAEPLDAAVVARLLAVAAAEPEVARARYSSLATKFATRELAGARREAVRAALEPWWRDVQRTAGENPAAFEAALVAVAGWKEPAALEHVRNVFASPSTGMSRRLEALSALVAADDVSLFPVVRQVLNAAQQNRIELRRRMLDALGRLSDPRVAEVVLAAYPNMEPDLKPQAIELLTQRESWSRALLDAIASGAIDKSALNVNQVRRLMLSKDPQLVATVQAAWGSVRTERNPARDEVIARFRTHVRQNPGDAYAGRLVFNKVCGQCHKIYGEGQEVGPDLTRNGRGSFEQLLSNVFDPSLVIGADYQARTVVTADGRILTGLLAEDNAQRLVLKVQGGKLETIPRDDVDLVEVSKLSLMPENLETQLTPEEISHLFAFITLDGPPEDPNARQLPGVRLPQARSTSDAAVMPELVAEVLPGFTTDACGEGGLAIVAEHMGRLGVLRTHPMSPRHPCVLRGTIDVPGLGKPRLRVTVAHDARGDWQLMAIVGQEVLHQSTIGPKAGKSAWTTVDVDLSKYAGQQIELQLVNRATGWSHEFGYWGAVELVTD